MIYCLRPLVLVLCLLPVAAKADGPRVLTDGPTVLTDMPVVQSLVAQVMGDLGTPQVLLQQGADLHSFQLRPSQVQAIAAADVLFWVGPELTPWLQDTLDAIGPASQTVALLNAPGVAQRGYDQAGTDPHAWLDPANAMVWLDVIAAELSARDQVNQPTYTANAAAAKAAILRLDADIKAILAPAAAAPLVVYHDAYGYFSTRYGLNIVGELELGDASAPSAERLAGIRAALQSEGAVCIFPEAQHDPKLLMSVVEGTGVRVGAAVDPEGTSLPYGPELYGALMIGLASAIADCVAQEG